MAKSKDKHPWFKFYPQDWRGDAKLRMCSVAARGLWTEMLCVMHEADPYGHLVSNGAPVATRQMAGLAGISNGECMKLLAELEAAGVYSRDEDKIIFSRRMVRDRAKAEKDRENGKGGGNPQVKGGVNKGVNPPVKGRDKAQRPEAIFQKPEQQACAPIDEDLKRRATAVGAGISAHFIARQMPIPNLERCETWLSMGYAQGTILAAVEAVLKRGTKPATLDYFDGAIRDMHAKAPAPIVLPPQEPYVLVVQGTNEAAAWDQFQRKHKLQPLFYGKHLVDGVEIIAARRKTLTPPGYDESNQTGEERVA